MEQLSPLLDNLKAKSIFNALQEHGFETRFIGGCVRDALLGRDVTDIDLATTATPEKVSLILGDKGIKTIPTGIAHGTITAVVDDQTFEITTLRQDIETNGRHATVAYSTDWEADAQRRDFTVNAISVDAAGNVFDYCGGLTDIETKNLRFIGDPSQRIQEDYLRILRFFRFASVLGWVIKDDGVIATCAALTPHLAQLSRERIQNELYKLFAGQACMYVAYLLNRHGILQFFCPNPDLGRFDDIVHGERRTTPDPFRRLLAIFGWHDEAALTKTIVLTGEQKKRLKDLLAIEQAADWPLAKQLYIFGPVTVMDFHLLNGKRLDQEILTQWQNPVFPLKAADVVHLTDGPGPVLGQILKQAENYWIDQGFKPNQQDLLAYCQSLT